MGAGDVDVNPVGIFQNFYPIKVYERRLIGFFHITEGAEIVETLEPGSGFAHGLHVEAVAHPPHIFFTESIAPLRDLIDVTAAPGIVSSMETCINWLYPQDVDVVREFVVEAHEYLIHREFGGWHFHVSHLASGVYTRIGTACPINFDLFGTKNFSRRRQEFALHRAVVFLQLPARVPRAVVFEGEFESHVPKNLSGKGRKKVGDFCWAAFLGCIEERTCTLRIYLFLCPHLKKHS